METWTDDDTGLAYVSCSQLTQGDYCGSSYCEANIRALEDAEGAIVRHGYHHSRQLWLPDNEENRETCRALEEDYPCYSDDEVSRVEMEWEEQAWESYGVADLRNNYRRGWKDRYRNEHAPRPALADALDCLADDVLFECYRSAMEAENCYPVFEDSGAALPLDAISECFAELAAERLMTAPGIEDQVRYEVAREHVGCLSGGMFFGERCNVGEALVAADWCEDNGHATFAAALRLPAEVDAAR